MRKEVRPNRVPVYKHEDDVYRGYFKNEEEFKKAMSKAAILENKGLKNRAWRVRLNLMVIFTCIVFLVVAY